eukprot:TRINITY_DN25869_c0_g1_i1.p1 TRINITY_DN25869_c0_g1~~TRINITY_DN25869_c0_g1_i1.p1  ORF type:complete len:146 (-),score=35.64 TRINITY_DN25869_c0_g1_i1:2-439(-)
MACKLKKVDPYVAQLQKRIYKVFDLDPRGENYAFPDKEVVAALRASAALIRASERMPRDRKELLEKVVREFLTSHEHTAEQIDSMTYQEQHDVIKTFPSSIEPPNFRPVSDIIFDKLEAPEESFSKSPLRRQEEEFALVGGCALF